MRVLVVCECSGNVREAFRAAGHEAYSNDVQPDEAHSPYHIQGDYRDALGYVERTGGVDIIVGHPPCTAVALSGNRWYSKGKPKHRARLAAIDFVREMAAKFDRLARVGWAIENPRSVLSSAWRTPSQTIQPYQFGHTSRKATCLWLRGLPELVPTDVVEPELVTYTRGDGRSTTFSADYGVGFGTKHGKRRSVTYSGIARAMAEQWGALAAKDRR